MSFVKKVSEEQAGPELRPLYQQIRQLYGFLPNYFQALGPLPKVIERERALAGVLLSDAVLPAALKAQIVLVVSGIHASTHCGAGLLELLQPRGADQSVVR